MDAAALVRRHVDADAVVGITGASGWFGRATISLLARARGHDWVDRHVVAFASAARTLELSDLHLPLLPLAELGEYPAITHLLHFAFRTPDRLATTGPDAYVANNLGIITLVGEAIPRVRPTTVVAVSSGAVHRPAAVLGDLRGEPYGTLKRLEEQTLAAATTDARAGLALIRSYAMVGPGVVRPESYALTDLCQQALRHGVMTIRATRPVVRSYCAIGDAVALGLAAACPGGVTFDTSGPVVELGAVARLIAELTGATLADRPFDAGAAEDRYVGDGTRMEALAAEHRLTLQPLDEALRDVLQDLDGDAALRMS